MTTLHGFNQPPRVFVVIGVLNQISFLQKEVH